MTTAPPSPGVSGQGARAPGLRTDEAGVDAGGRGSRVGALAGALALGLLTPHRAHLTPAVSGGPLPPTTTAGHAATGAVRSSAMLGGRAPLLVGPRAVVCHPRPALA